MSKSRLGRPTRRGSWARRAKIVEVERKGRDVLNPTQVRWFDLFEALEIVPQNGDILYTVQDGDRLDKLANRFYGTVALWWVIALANDIDEPVVGLLSGTDIIIPAPAYVDTEIAGVRQSVQRGLR
jgi:nucleoid-associated protein YgaU